MATSRDSIMLRALAYAAMAAATTKPGRYGGRYIARMALPKVADMRLADPSQKAWGDAFMILDDDDPTAIEHLTDVDVIATARPNEVVPMGRARAWFPTFRRVAGPVIEQEASGYALCAGCGYAVNLAEGYRVDADGRHCQGALLIPFTPMEWREWYTANQSMRICLAARMVTRYHWHETVELYEVARQMLDRLDNLYDVDTIVGDQSVTYRESPYSGAGADMEMLKAALNLERVRTRCEPSTAS